MRKVLEPSCFCLRASLLFALFIGCRGDRPRRRIEEQMFEPINTLQVQRLDRSEAVNFRTDVCSRQALLAAGEIEASNALANLSLSVVTTDYSYPDEMFLFSKSIDSDTSDTRLGRHGFFAQVMDEIARRAEFTWREKVAAVPPISKGDNITWSDILEWGTERFDISLEKWTHTTQRMSDGISFPVGYYEADTVLIGRAGSFKKRSQNVYGFLAPFEPAVWIASGLIMIVTGLLYWVIERLDHNSDANELQEKPIVAIFLSAMAVTGHFSFRPVTNPARALAFSWSFWALIVGSAYTANMAGFLVSRQATITQITSINQAAYLRTPVCVLLNSAQHIFLKKRYPTLPTVGLEKEVEVFNGIADDKCELIVSQSGSFFAYKRKRNANLGCRLYQVGGLLRSTIAGVATALDTGRMCTSLISHVLSIHLEAMQQDGVLEEMWQRHLDFLGDQSCPDDVDPDDEDDNFSLSLYDMSGIFIVHAGFILLSLTMAFIERRKHRIKGGESTHPLKTNEEVQSSTDMWSFRDRENLGKDHPLEESQGKEDPIKANNSPLDSDTDALTGGPENTVSSQSLWGPAFPFEMSQSKDSSHSELKSK